MLNVRCDIIVYMCSRKYQATDTVLNRSKIIAPTRGREKKITRELGLYYTVKRGKKRKRKTKICMVRQTMPSKAKPSKQRNQNIPLTMYIGLESKLEKPTKVRPLKQAGLQSECVLYYYFFFLSFIHSFIRLLLVPFALGYVSRIAFNSYNVFSCIVTSFIQNTHMCEVSPLLHRANSIHLFGSLVSYVFG